MKGQLKSIGTNSADFSVDDYQPEEKDSFGLWIHLIIGPDDQSGGHDFEVFICTPEWLCKHQWTPKFMRHTLLVRRYDLNEIKNNINDYIDQCEGNDWMEMAQKLSRVFAWEYEDYHSLEQP